MGEVRRVSSGFQRELARARWTSSRSRRPPQGGDTAGRHGGRCRGRNRPSRPYQRRPRRRRRERTDTGVTAPAAAMEAVGAADAGTPEADEQAPPASAHRCGPGGRALDEIVAPLDDERRVLARGARESAQPAVDAGNDPGRAPDRAAPAADHQRHRRGGRHADRLPGLRLDPGVPHAGPTTRSPTRLAASPGAACCTDPLEGFGIRMKTSAYVGDRHRHAGDPVADLAVRDAGPLPPTSGATPSPSWRRRAVPVLPRRRARLLDDAPGARVPRQHRRRRVRHRFTPASTSSSSPT